MARFVAASVKQAASGRWGEILSALGGIDASLLDGRHHPCPQCGGTDRFRALDDFDQSGAVLCNQCFAEKNGDGLAALQWLRGCDFPTALSDVATHLGVKPSRNGEAKKREAAGKKPADSVQWPPNHAPHRDALLVAWCNTRPPVTMEAVGAFGGKFCWWPKNGVGNYRCIAFQGRDAKGSPASLLLYRVTGESFPATGDLDTRKTHTVGGSKESWVWPGGPERLQSAAVIVKVEGVTDALALWSIGLPDDWLVLTNACGAKSASPRRLSFSFAAGKQVVVVGDCDKPGQEGARRFAAGFHAAGASDVRLMKLPYPVAKDQGKDLRDWLAEKRTFNHFRELAEKSKPVTAERAAKWRPKARKQPAIAAGDDPGIIKILSDKICRDNHFAQDAGGKLYRFSDGTYKRRADQFVKGHVKVLCEEHGRTGEWSSRLGSEVVEYIRIDRPELWERPPLEILNVRNGLLRIADRKLLPHSPNHLTPVQLPAEYDPKATCPAIDQFVKEVFPSDALDLAWEVPAWLMLPATSIQKAVLLSGEGGNGKSTWLAMVTAFLGGRNTAGVALHTLESNHFITPRLLGKLANVCPDLPSRDLSGTSVFKAITGGDTVYGEYKFGDSFEFVPFCRLVFSANHPPRSGDSSTAFFRAGWSFPLTGHSRARAISTERYWTPACRPPPNCLGS